MAARCMQVYMFGWPDECMGDWMLVKCSGDQNAVLVRHQLINRVPSQSKSRGSAGTGPSVLARFLAGLD